MSAERNLCFGSCWSAIYSWGGTIFKNLFSVVLSVSYLKVGCFICRSLGFWAQRRWAWIALLGSKCHSIGFTVMDFISIFLRLKKRLHSIFWCFLISLFCIVSLLLFHSSPFLFLFLETFFILKVQRFFPSLRASCMTVETVQKLGPHPASALD